MSRKETAKSFMFVAVGIFALVGTAQLVIPGAAAQSPQPTNIAAAYAVITSLTAVQVAVTVTGDVYQAPIASNEWVYQTNIFTASNTVPLSRASMGEVKQIFGK